MNWTVTTTEANGNVSTIGATSRKAARELVAAARAEGLESTYANVEFIDSPVSIPVEAPTPEYPEIEFTVRDVEEVEAPTLFESEADSVEWDAQTAPAPTTHTPTVSILTAMDTAMSRIRDLNPNVPTALAVIIASGSGKKHGHFEPGSWADTTGEHAGSGRHEILMSSESLARGAEPTLVTLIHEAAHASAHAQDIKDTSRQGRFHNRKFRDTAESMGLIVEENSSIGHVTTGLTEQAKVDYADILELLAASLTTHRKPARAKEAKEKTTVKVGCDCYDDNGKPMAVTVPIKWYNTQQLVCEACESYLNPVG